MAPGKLKDTIPSITGTRNLGDNLSDLRAQVAANNKGIGLVDALIEEYTLPVVQAYMGYIQVWKAKLCDLVLNQVNTGLRVEATAS